MTPKMYTASVLIAAGIGATVGNLAPIASVNARETTRNVHVVKQVPTGNPAVNAIIASAKYVLCPLIEAEANMAEGSCKVRPGSLITITVGDPSDPGSSHQATLEVPVKISEVADSEQ